MQMGIKFLEKINFTTISINHHKSTASKFFCKMELEPPLKTKWPNVFFVLFIEGPEGLNGDQELFIFSAGNCGLYVFRHRE